MRKFSVVFMLISAIVLMPVMALYAQSTKLQNGDFETGDLTGWSGGLPNSQVQSDEKHGGDYAFEINGYLGPGFSALYQQIAVTNGQVVEFKGWIKIDLFTSAGEGAGIGLKIEGAGINKEIKLDEPTSGWVEISVSGTATTNGTVSCMIFEWNASNVVAYFDDLTAPGEEGEGLDTLNVIVSIFKEIIGVDFIATEYNFGTVKAGSTNVSSGVASIISNSGTCAERYSFKITDPPGWTSSTNAPGPDIFVLNGALSTNVTGITWNVANHAFSTTPQVCTDTKFAGDETGVAVPAGALRHLWLQFLAPTSSSVFTPQTIPITVSAEAE